VTSGGLLNPSPAPQSKMFELLDVVADAYQTQEGEEMGFHNDKLTKESAAAGAKLAKEHESTVQSDNRKATNYSKWLNDQSNATQTRKSKTPIKK
jgi:hypothetical protein